MTTEPQIDKIVQYLKKYKSELKALYKWSPKIDKLVELEVLTADQVKEINVLSPYEKDVRIRQMVGDKLKETKELKTNTKLFDDLCLWVIKDWGEIKTAVDNGTLKQVKDFLNQDKPSFNRIASTSKVGAFLNPESNVIYDSRVSYALNWIILSENIDHEFFPIPEGRNTKMAAFDMNVLIRIKNISEYQPEDIEELDQKLFINNKDKKLFIDRKDAYFELNNLIKIVNQKLWNGDDEMSSKLYNTEMLLFSIADREVFYEITAKYREILYH